MGISGFNTGDGCFSTPGSFALGLGDGTVATSAGFLTSAIAIGLGNGQTELTQATSFGTFSFAWAGGPDTLAETTGNLGLAVMQGENARALAGGSGTEFDNLNLAFNFGNGFDTGITSTDPSTNSVQAVGQGNIAANIVGDSIPGANMTDTTAWSVVRAGGITVTPLAVGFADAAYNIFGNGNQVAAGDQGSNFGLAFSVFGDRNDVDVNGPAAAGGALFQSDRIIVQDGPGIEVNGVPRPTSGNTSLLDNFAPTTLAGTANEFGSQLSGSLMKAGEQFSSSLNQISLDISR